ncbi:MAG: hypothetical protein Q8P63_01260 [Candidatus Nealsonbacteria bacterium]|nr:hypothetical protein [Candidatus Nealsonbacteria bacterium]
MQKQVSSKLVALTFGVLVISLVIAFYAVAWTEPSQSPPGGNVATPLNIGPTGQSKEGGLILNTGGAAIGLIVVNGDVGIGTTNPGAKLDVQGGDIRVGIVTIKGDGSVSPNLNADMVDGKHAMSSCYMISDRFCSFSIWNQVTLSCPSDRLAVSAQMNVDSASYNYGGGNAKIVSFNGVYGGSATFGVIGLCYQINLFCCK